MRSLVLQSPGPLSSLPRAAPGPQFDRSLLPGFGFHLRAHRGNQTKIDIGEAGRSHPHDRSRSSVAADRRHGLRGCAGRNGFGQTEPEGSTVCRRSETGRPRYGRYDHDPAGRWSPRGRRNATSLTIPRCRADRAQNCESIYACAPRPDPSLRRASRTSLRLL